MAPREQSFTFNIQPGMPVKGVSFAKAHPNPEMSIFNDYQLRIIEQIVDYHLSNAQSEYQNILTQEKNTAYQNGVQAGQKQTQQQYQKQLNQTIQSLNVLTQEFKSFTDHLAEEQEQNLLLLTLKLARKVIDTELEINPNAVLNVLRNCLNLINEREEIKILVNPNDWTVVKNNINQLNLRIDLPKQIDIVNSPQISPGGCRIEYKSGSIDADIDTQFEEIRRKILKYAETD